MKFAVLALTAASVALVGCSRQNIAEFEQRTMRNSASSECAKAGWTADHPRHEECIQNTIPLLIERDRRAQAQANENLAAALIVGAAAYGAAQGGANETGGYSTGYESPGTSYPLTRQWIEIGGARMCQYGNGTVLNLGSRTCPASIRS